MASTNGTAESEVLEENVPGEINGALDTPTTPSLSPQKQENGVTPSEILNGRQNMSLPNKIDGTLERKSRNKETEKDRTNLYLRGLPHQEDYTESDLMSAFHPFGKVVSVKIMTERNPTTSGAQPRTGIGFVRFNTEEEARNALLSLSGKPVMIKGRPVRLEAKYADKQASNIRNNSHNSLTPLVSHVSNTFLPPHMPHKLFQYYNPSNPVQELMYFQSENMLPRHINVSKSDIEGITRSAECLNLDEQKKSARLDGSITMNPYNSYGSNQWSGNPQTRVSRRPKVRYPNPCVPTSLQITSNQRQSHPGQMTPTVANVNAMRNVHVQPQNASKNERPVMAIPNYVDAEVLTNYQLMAPVRRPDAQAHPPGAVVMPPAGGNGGQYPGYAAAVSPPQYYSIPTQNAVPCNQSLPIYYQSLTMQHSNNGVDCEQQMQSSGVGQPMSAGATSLSGQGYNMVYSPRVPPQPATPHAQAAPTHGVLPHLQAQSTVGTHWNPAEIVPSPQGSLSLNGIGRPGNCHMQPPPIPANQQQPYGPPNGCVPFQVVMQGSRVFQTMPYTSAVAAACPPGVVHQQPQLQQMACLPDYGNSPVAATHSQLSVSTGQTESVNGPPAKS